MKSKVVYIISQPIVLAVVVGALILVVVSAGYLLVTQHFSPQPTPDSLASSSVTSIPTSTPTVTVLSTFVPTSTPASTTVPTTSPTLAPTATATSRTIPTETPTPLTPTPAGSATAKPLMPTSTPTTTRSLTDTPSPTLTVAVSSKLVVVQRFFSPGPAPAALAVTSDSLWVADDKDRLLHQLDRAGSPKAFFPITVTGAIRGLAWDGNALYVALSDGSEKNQIARLDGTGMVLDSFLLKLAPIGLGWNLDGGTLWTASQVSGEAFLLEFDTEGKLLQTLHISVFGPIGALTWAPDGVWLVTAAFSDWYCFGFTGEELNEGDLPFALSGISALAWDERTDLWLVAQNERRIYQLSLSQEELGIVPTPMPEMTLPRPKLEPVPSTNRAIVKVTNSLQGTLSLSFGGKPAILRPGDTWSSELDQGVYTVYASANVPESIAFSGEELLVGSYEYKWSLEHPD